MIVYAEDLTVSIGAANPIPTFASTVPAGIWSLIPITELVATSMSGPPELPWLIAASVWIEPGIEKPFGAEIVRLMALTMPALIDSEYCGLSGVPIATTVWPGSTV